VVNIVVRGAMFGLVYGWLPGGAVFLALFFTRPSGG
jgi:hypothetical protein